MNKLFTLMAAIALTVSLSSCSTLNSIAGGDRLAQVKLGLDAVLLDREFEAAYEAMLFNDWTSAELAEVELHLAGLQKLRNGLGDVAKLNIDGSDAMLTLIQARDFLNNLSIHFNALDGLYNNYIARTGLTPDPSLIAYRDSGIAVWNELAVKVGQLRENPSVAEIQDALTYIVRGYALYKINPAAATTRALGDFI